VRWGPSGELTRVYILQGVEITCKEDNDLSRAPELPQQRSVEHSDTVAIANAWKSFLKQLWESLASIRVNPLITERGRELETEKYSQVGTLVCYETVKNLFYLCFNVSTMNRFSFEIAPRDKLFRLSNYKNNYDRFYMRFYSTLGRSQPRCKLLSFVTHTNVFDIQISSYFIATLSLVHKLNTLAKLILATTIDGEREGDARRW